MKKRYTLVMGKPPYTEAALDFGSTGKVTLKRGVLPTVEAEEAAKRVFNVQWNLLLRNMLEFYNAHRLDCSLTEPAQHPLAAEVARMFPQVVDAEG